MSSTDELLEYLKGLSNAGFVDNFRPVNAMKELNISKNQLYSSLRVLEKHGLIQADETVIGRKTYKVIKIKRGIET